MTFDEFKKIGIALTTYYPKEKDSLLKDEHAVRLWFEALKDIPYKTMYLALNKWVETERWSPTIADLRRLSFEIQNPEIPTWDEAWETVMQAIRTYGYNRRIEAMDSFDEITRKTVSRIGWIQICTSEEIGIERAAFRDIYKALSDKTKTEGQIAPAVKKVIESTRQAHVQALETKRDQIVESNKMITESNDDAVVGVPENIQSKLDELRKELKR